MLAKQVASGTKWIARVVGRVDVDVSKELSLSCLGSESTRVCLEEDFGGVAWDKW